LPSHPRRTPPHPPHALPVPVHVHRVHHETLAKRRQHRGIALPVDPLTVDQQQRWFVPTWSDRVVQRGPVDHDLPLHEPGATRPRPCPVVRPQVPHGPPCCHGPRHSDR